MDQLRTEDQQRTGHAQRSTFVSAVAVICGGYYALNTVGALLYLVIGAGGAASGDGGLGLALILLVFGLVAVLMSGAMVWVCLGLWKRHEWARRTFVVLTGISFVLLAICAVLSPIGGMAELVSGEGWGRLAGLLGGVCVLVVAGASALLQLWLFKRFRSDAVKAEFHSSPRI